MIKPILFTRHSPNIFNLLGGKVAGKFADVSEPFHKLIACGRWDDGKIACPFLVLYRSVVHQTTTDTEGADRENICFNLILERKQEIGAN